MASRLEGPSDLQTILRTAPSFFFIFSKNDHNVLTLFFSNELFINSILFCASLSFATTSNTLPGSGILFIPRSCTGSHHVAVLIACPAEFIIFLIFPYVLCTTTISHTFSVPVNTINEVRIPCFASLCASMITPTAGLFGSYLRSRSSDWNNI